MMPWIFKKSPFFLYCLTTLTFALCSTISLAQEVVSIQDAWARSTKPGQNVGAAYMTFTSAQNLVLTHVESDISNSVEIHSMTMEKNVMKMRKLDELELNAGEPYKLEPGSFHLMLFDLKAPLTVDRQITFELTFKTNSNHTFKQKVSVPVKDMSPAQKSSHDMHEHNHP